MLQKGWGKIEGEEGKSKWKSNGKKAKLVQKKMFPSFLKGLFFFFFFLQPRSRINKRINLACALIRRFLSWLYNFTKFPGCKENNHPRRTPCLGLYNSILGLIGSRICSAWPDPLPALWSQTKPHIQEPCCRARCHRKGIKHNPYSITLILWSSGLYLCIKRKKQTNKKKPILVSSPSSWCSMGLPTLEWSRQILQLNWVRRKYFVQLP